MMPKSEIYNIKFASTYKENIDGFIYTEFFNGDRIINLKTKLYIYSERFYMKFNDGHNIFWDKHFYDKNGKKSYLRSDIGSEQYEYDEIGVRRLKRRLKVTKVI